MKPGTRVINLTRQPSPDQPWIHPPYIGMVVSPGTDKESWNGANSEADYCKTTGRVPVAYEFGRHQESPENLVHAYPMDDEIIHDWFVINPPRQAQWINTVAKRRAVRS